jgi:hypothetical protein
VALDDDTPHVGPDIQISPAAGLALAKAFAAKSRHLEHLSVSYMIDAQQFFTSCQQLPCTRHFLKSLTLTSSTLSWRTPRENIYTLLQDASLVAQRTPQLQTMVLWNSAPRQVCALIYRRHIGGAMATLTWRGTWDLELSDDVVESWKKVCCYLRVEKEELRDVDIRSHGDAIHHLRLPEGVIDSESLCQICREGRMQRLA